MKKLSRELVSSLRSAEILFTWAWNVASKESNHAAAQTLSDGFSSNLIKARRNLALFQHHDAITGTAKQFVTHDYGEKLFDGIIATRNLMKISAQYLLMTDRKNDFQRRFLESDYSRPDYGSREKPLALDVKDGPRYIVLFNNQGQAIDEVVSFFLDGISDRKEICVQDPLGNFLPVQFNPTWTTEGFIRLEKHFMEVSFIARMPALSLNKFKITICHDLKDSQDKNRMRFSPSTKVYCLKCPKILKSSDLKKEEDAPMLLEKISEGAVVISNAHLELEFDQDTHLLKQIKDKASNVTKKVKMVFGGYPTMQFRNGAYLFKPDTNRNVQPIIDPLDNLKEIVIISGQIFSEISLIYEAGSSLTLQGSFVHTLRLYHDSHEGSNLAKAIYMENNFNFGDQNNFRDVDMFMRLESDLTNHRGQWYSDSSGLSMQKRLKAVNASGLEGNTFPITSQIYLVDQESRLTLLVDHATGASSTQQVLEKFQRSLHES